MNTGNISSETQAVNLTKAIDNSISYLSSAAALQSIERDPYWPKWDSPWWHMRLLQEMGLARQIPASTVSKMATTLKSHYLPAFPIKEEEVPKGTDPFRKIACHCAVGSMYQVMFDCGVDLDHELPWMRPWFLRYQLPDGGLNCDEQAYTKPNPKSSIVTTLNCLEAILFCKKRELSSDETLFLNRGAEYLLKHRLFRKAFNGEVIDQDWLEMRFPRFYEYDFLRGYYFLEKWRQASGFSIPDDLVDEVESLVSKQLTAEGIRLKRYNLFDKRSYNPNADGSWAWGQATEFDLMKAASFEGAICEPITKQWNEVKPKFATAIESYEIAYPNPIKLNVGDSVRIEKRETNPDWLGWVYCVNSRGIGGWVSEKYLKESGSAAIATKPYDATELAAQAGERLKIYFEEFGWHWCRNERGVKGWVPTKNLTVNS